MMLDAGADKQAKNGARKTALEYAIIFFYKGGDIKDIQNKTQAANIML